MQVASCVAIGRACGMDEGNVHRSFIGKKVWEVTSLDMKSEMGR
jgi:hypothetical protein